MGLDKSAINPATGKAYAINPNSGVWDDNYFATQVEPQYNAQHGINNQSSQAAPSTQDIIANAQKIRDFNIQSNQPAIQTLQTQQGGLTDRYNKLLDSIKGQQQVAEDSQIKATSNELGRRGINNQSGVYEQQQADALRPIAAQFQGLTAQTGLAQEQDQNTLANAIAALQSGNPESAVSTGTNIANMGQQAYQFSTNLAAQQQAQQIQQQQAAAQLAQAQKAQDLQSLIYQTINLPESKANIANINSQIGNRGYANAPLSSDISALQNILGGGNANTKPSLDSFYIP